MRDKEWLKKMVDEKSEVVSSWALGRSDKSYWKNDNLKINKGLLFDLIDQLDEPETLSQEWIDENKVARINDVRKMTTSDVVPVEKLKNLPVSKQDKQEVEENFYTFDNAKKWLHDNGFVVFEKDKLDEEIQRIVDETYEATNEKPVIPQFVADWYESEGKRSSWWNWFYKWGRGEHRTDLETKTIRWMQDFNEELFVDMFRFGYEVEEEKLYTVKLSQPKGVFPHYKGDELFISKYAITTNSDWEYNFTEAEIKAIDERYWAFAEEVTE